MNTENILNKKISRQNMIFITVVTIIVIALIFALIAFIGLFRSNLYRLQSEVVSGD